MMQTEKKSIENIVKEQAQMIREMFGNSDAKRDESLGEPQGIIAYRDLKYDEYNSLDIYMPEGISGDTPVIVNVHGGAYVYGSKENYKYYGMFLAQQGFIFVNADYRLAPEYKFPTQLKDLSNVFMWMVENKEKYGMDLKNMFLVGDSAGAQMASQLGVIYSNPKYASLFEFAIPKEIVIRAMALNCGMYDLKTLAYIPRANDEFMDNYVLMESYLGEEGRKQKEQLEVLENIKNNYPPCYVMTSYYDFLREEAEPFYTYLKNKKVEAIYRLYGEAGQEYMGHIFHCNMNLNESKECNMDECKFFEGFLKN